jgi:carbon-monoxide dehydrogenase medium subunit
VKPASFEYHAPATLEEAVGLLAANDDAKVLAGGQSLVPLMNMRLARPAVVVDLNRIGGLDYVRADGELAVGALVRHNDLLRSEAVRRGWPLMHEAAGFIGHPAIRNRGTVCGSLAHADPAAEHPAVLAALDGTVVVQGPGGRREVRADEFFLTYLTTSLSADEIVVEARYPRLPEGTGTCFLELARRHGDFAIVGVAAALTLRDGVCTDARLALTGVGGTPFRAREAEEMLRGRRLAGEDARAAFQEAGRQIAGAVEPDDDIHASARYRKHLSGVLTERALAKALERAGGN